MMKIYTKDYYASLTFYSKFNPLLNNYITPSFQNFLLNYETYMSKHFNQSIYNYEKVKNVLYDRNGKLRKMDEQLYYEMCDLVIEYTEFNDKNIESYTEELEGIRTGNYSQGIKELAQSTYYDCRISDIDYQKDILMIEIDQGFSKVRYSFKITEFILKIPWKKLVGCLILQEEFFIYPEKELFEYNLLLTNTEKAQNDESQYEIGITFSDILYPAEDEVRDADEVLEDIPYYVLSDRNLLQTDFAGMDLTSISLSSSQLFDANFKGANLANTDFSYCKLHGANLKGKNLKLSNLTGTIFDETTIWPKGFNPIAKGASVIPRKMVESISALDSQLPIKMQKNAIKNLTLMDSEHCDLLIEDAVSIWSNVAKVMKVLGYPRNKKAIIGLFTKNFRWSERLEFFPILKEVGEKDRRFLISLIENSVLKTCETREGFHMFRIYKYFFKYAKLSENDFTNKDVFKMISL